MELTFAESSATHRTRHPTRTHARHESTSTDDNNHHSAPLTTTVIICLMRLLIDLYHSVGPFPYLVLSRVFHPCPSFLLSRSFCCVVVFAVSCNLGVLIGICTSLCAMSSCRDFFFLTRFYFQFASGPFLARSSFRNMCLIDQNFSSHRKPTQSDLTLSLHRNIFVSSSYLARIGKFLARNEPSLIFSSDGSPGPGVCTVLDDDDSDTEASVRSVTSPALSMCSLALTIAAFCALCTGQARQETDALDKFPGNPVQKDTEARPAQKI